MEVPPLSTNEMILQCLWKSDKDKGSSTVPTESCGRPVHESMWGRMSEGKYENIPRYEHVSRT